MKKDDFTKIPMLQILAVPEKGQFCEIVRDHWWAVSEDDCILMYRGYNKQCNSNRGIVERIIKGENHPGVKVVFIQAAFLPHDCNDYI